MSQLTAEHLRLLAKIAEKMAEIIEGVKKAWNYFKERVSKVLPSLHTKYFKRQAAIQRMRVSWSTRLDARRSHQVLNNKPRYMIRKVM